MHQILLETQISQKETQISQKNGKLMALTESIQLRRRLVPVLHSQTISDQERPKEPI